MLWITLHFIGLPRRNTDIVKFLTAEKNSDPKFSVTMILFSTLPYGMGTYKWLCFSLRSWSVLQTSQDSTMWLPIKWILLNTLQRSLSIYILHCCYNKVFHARFDACNYVSTVHLQYITAIAIWTLKVDHATQLYYASSIPYIFIVDVLATYMVMQCKLSSFDYYHAVSVTCSYTGEGI